LKYLKKILAEESVLIKDAEVPQITRTKHKEVIEISSENEARWQPSKKVKGK